MTLEDMDLIDRAAMLVSTGLMLLGIVVLGLVEVLDGPPYGAAPTTNDAGEVIAQPGIDPGLRTGLVVAALIILLLWAIYKLVTPVGETPVGETTGTETAAR